MENILFVIIIIAVVFTIFNRKIEPYAPFNLLQDKRYQSTSLPIDTRYVYYPDRNIYLLPLDKLDFNNPYHVWMYNAYPEFYVEKNHYHNYPYVGQPRWIR